MKSIDVVAAIIRHDGRVLATQRGYGDYAGGWEFPGGKIEPGEAPEAALIREICEELNAEIAVGDLLQTIEWDYPTFHLTMHCYLCTLTSDNLNLNEHADSAWLTKETLATVQWLPADVVLLDAIAERL